MLQTGLKPLTDEDLKKIEEAAFQVACEQAGKDTNVVSLLKDKQFKKHIDLIYASISELKYAGPLQTTIENLKKAIEYLETEKIVYKNITYKKSKNVPVGRYSAKLIDIKVTRDELPIEKIKLWFVFNGKDPFFLTHEPENLSLQHTIDLAMCIEKNFNVSVENINNEPVITCVAYGD